MQQISALWFKQTPVGLSKLEKFDFAAAPLMMIIHKHGFIEMPDEDSAFGNTLRLTLGSLLLPPGSLRRCGRQ